MRKRTVILFSFIMLSFVILFLRIYVIIMDEQKFKVTGISNSYIVTVDKSRGMIYDRNLEPLVNEQQVYRAVVLPSPQTKIKLSSILTPQQREAIEPSMNSGKPFVIAVDELSDLGEGIEVFSIKKRYGSNSLARHIIGYCDGALSRGLTGIEKAFDSFLSQQSGQLVLRYKIDALGKALVGISPEIENDGYASEQGVVLTLDKQIQAIAEQAAQGLPGKGSIVVMDVQNGDILASVSLPTFDQNDVSSSLDNDEGALVNRSLSTYNVGSTFKLSVAAAALEQGISPYFSYKCTGTINVAGQTFSCHKGEGHGTVWMKTAISGSCNPYFIKLVQSVLPRNLIKMAGNMGYGRSQNLAPGFKLAAGYLPSVGELANPADIANISFGQGKLMATPVHVAQAISSIANGGYAVSANLYKGITDPTGQKLETAANSTTPIRIMSDKTAARLREYMIYTVDSGTGRIAKPNHGGAGGKTASAETGWKVNGEDLVQGWFSGFYPAQNPKYAIVVLCEGGKSGATSGGPVFKSICDQLYSLTNKD